MSILTDSLVFPDMVITIALMVVVLALLIYLTNLLIKLSIIDYRASMGTYLFNQCLSGNLTITTFNHLVLTEGHASGNYLIVCPRVLAVNNSQLNITVYVAYTR